MSSKLHVANLQPWVTSAYLARTFRYFGLVESAYVVTDEHDGASCGYGFVEMANAHGAQAAIERLNSTLFDGQMISVQPAEPTVLHAVTPR